MKKKKEDDFEEMMKNIDWTRWMQVIIPIMQPVLVFGGWLAFAKFDKRADALSKLIALAEPIPMVDLNLPKPVVLASLFHSTDVALKILNDVIEFLKDIEIPSKDEVVEEIKELLEEEVIEPVKEEIFETVEEILPDSPQFKKILANCVMNAKANLGITYWVLGPPWIVSCMAQKGLSISIEVVKEQFF